MSKRADVLILGSGQAGVPLASRLAKAGRRTVLFEEGDLGRTCVNVGCTPTKTMIGADVVVRLGNGSELAGSHLLVAVGRRANTEGLRCDAAGARAIADAEFVHPTFAEEVQSVVSRLARYAPR
jgi:pyruvate/2-oxoglutarate dehydrogenase complex dihydrolipoamide dehydrogenase (E3) component